LNIIIQEVAQWTVVNRGQQLKHIS
jgi:hypothetical protein